VWNFYGTQLYSTAPSVDELYEVSWRPCHEGVLPAPEVRVATVKSSATSAAAPQQQQCMF